MAAIFKLLGGVKGIAIIVLLIAAAGYVWKQNKNLEKAQQATELAIAQRDAQKNELEKALVANKANQETFERMEQERADIQTALNNLEAARRRDSAVIGQLSTAIRAQASNPANQVTLSPVLKDTLASIQAERARRQGTTR